MPLLAAIAVHALRMAHVQGPEHALQTIVAVGHRDQVDVIAHQAVGEHLHPMLAAILPQRVQIRIAVLIGEEHRFAPVAALGHVVRYTCEYGP